MNSVVTHLSYKRLVTSSTPFESYCLNICFLVSSLWITKNLELEMSTRTIDPCGSHSELWTSRILFYSSLNSNANTFQFEAPLIRCDASSVSHGDTPLSFLKDSCGMLRRPEKTKKQKSARAWLQQVTTSKWPHDLPTQNRMKNRIKTRLKIKKWIKNQIKIIF